MNEYKAIKTEYNGYRFNSRLEARWAVFFDAMGIKYMYEPEGFYLEYGMKYLPDFALFNVKWRGNCDAKPLTPIYVEVKGADNYTSIKIDDRVRLESFAKKMPLVILGGIPLNADSLMENCASGLSSFWFLDGDMYPGFFSRYHGEIWFTGPDHIQFSSASTERALAIARQARFEFGETPDPSKVKNNDWRQR